MYISPYNRSKISVLSFVLIVMVVFIHSYYLELQESPFAWIQYLVNGICRVANPLFFFISGMLFFNGVNTVKDCFPKMKKRVKSLLIPYLIWNIVFVLWYVVLSIIPGVSGFVNSDILKQFQGNIGDSFSFLYLKPANFPLWFLRDLICLVFFSPAIYYLLKYTKIWIILVLIILSPWVSCVFTGLHVFFFIGGYIALNHSLQQIDKFITKPVYFISSLLYCGIIYFAATQQSEIIRFSEIILNIGAVAFVWKTYDIIAKGRIAVEYRFWKFVLGYSFFIYLFHEPTFNIIKKIPVRVVGGDPLFLVLFYFINPLILVAISIIVAKFLQKKVPAIYSIVVGGR